MQYGVGYAAKGFMDGFLNGYKAFPDADDQQYKRLRNAIAKQRLDPTNLKLQQDLLRSRAEYMRERGSRGASDRTDRDALQRERMKGVSLDNEYRAFRNKQLGQPVPSRVDDVVPSGPASAIPAGPGGSPGTMSQLDQDQDDEQDTNEDVAGDQQDTDQEPVQSAARGGMISAIPPRAGNRYAEGGGVVPNNFDAAHRALKMTPQEQALYKRHLTNLNGQGGVDNPDGSRSSLYQAVQEHNGKFHNIPTVWNGKRETEPYTKADGTKMDVPNATALANVEKEGWDKFPAYATPDEADSRYDDMHKFMDKDTEAYQNSKNYADGGDVEDDDTEEEEPDEVEGTSPEEQDAQQTSMLAAHDAARDGILHSVAQNNVGGYGLAVPGPSQASSNRNHLVGAGAFTPAEMDAIRKKVDPDGKMDPSDRNMAALSAVHTYWLKQGNPKAAQEMASSMVAYLRKDFDRNKAMAGAAAEHGDIDTAIDYSRKAYAALPDGMKYDAKKNEDGSYTYNLLDGRTGKPLFKPQTVTPEVMLKQIQDSANSSFDGLMAAASGHRAGLTKPPPEPKVMKPNDQKTSEGLINDAWASRLEEDTPKDGKPPEYLPANKRVYMDSAFHIMNSPQNKLTSNEAVGLALRMGSINPDHKFKAEDAKGGKTVTFKDGKSFFVPESTYDSLITLRGSRAAEAKKQAEEDAKPNIGSRVMSGASGVLSGAIGNIRKSYQSMKEQDARDAEAKAAIPPRATQTERSPTPAWFRGAIPNRQNFPPVQGTE